MAQRTTTEVHGQIRARHWRRMRRLGQGALILLVLFLLFEVGIRHVPPDGMTVTGIGYSEVGYPDSFGTTRTFTSSYTEPKDQQTINDLYASLNAAPAFFSPIFFSQPVNVHCALLWLPYPTSIAFTWHGIPLETWFTSGCVVRDTAGGIPDVFTRHLWQLGGPLPPPATS